MPAGGRLRVRAARHVLVLAVALAAMGLLAVNHRSNAAWLMVSLAAAAAVASLAHGRRNLAGVAAGLLPCAPLPAGEPVVLTVRAHNPTRRDAHGLTVRAADGAEAAIAIVPAGGDAEAAIALAPLPRGVHPAPVLALASSYPLGLVLWWRPLAAAGELVVHPAARGRPLATAGGGGQGAAPDEAQSGDNDFRGHRRLHPGDSQRRVDWKASERGEHLLVKDWSGSGGERRVLAWADALGGDEERLGELARWVLEADAGGAPYALVLPGLALAADSGVAHRHACLRALAAHPAGRR